MPTVAALNLASTTTDPQVFSCRGATQLQINVSVAGCFLAFANEIQGVLQGFGVEEFHGPEIVTISDEPIGAVQYRSVPGAGSATLTIIASR